MKISNLQNYIDLKSLKIENYDYINILCLKYNDLKDIDFLRYVLKNIHNIQIIHCDSYRCLEIINDILEDETNILFKLLDDGLTIDRSYINFDRVDKISNISLPITYIMWDVDIKDTQLVSCYTAYFSNKLLAVSSGGNTEISKKSLVRIKNIVNNIYKKQDLDDLEKTMIISNYLQSKVEYVDIDRTLTGLAETILFDNYGICMGISNATVLLSNNPIFGLNTRNMFGCGHVWNVQTHEDNSYYIDNTWNITRNDNKISDKLKAAAFSDKFILFGKKTADSTGYNIPVSIALKNTKISEEDYDRKK